MGKEKLIDLTGRQFGRLVVLARAENGRTRHPRWLCRCSCGNEKPVLGDHLKAGKIVSCGCYAADVNRATKKTHGKTNTPTYITWQAMKARCFSPSRENYAHYGGAGISICERWMMFENFLADIGERPRGKTLDRIDPSGEYSPENCRWASQVEQCNNKRGSVRYEAFGRRQTIAEWSRESGLSRAVIRRRLDIHGMPMEQALSQSSGMLLPEKGDLAPIPCGHTTRATDAACEGCANQHRPPA